MYLGSVGLWMSKIEQRVSSDIGCRHAPVVIATKHPNVSSQ